MLRSWTKRIGLEKDLRVGIALSRDNWCAVALDGGKDSPKMAWNKQGRVEQPLFTADKASDSLNSVLSSIVDSITDASLPVNVAIPDTVIRAATFELGELPKSGKTLSSLARWRMSDELGRGEDELIYQTMSLGEDNGKHLLYVQAGDRFWLEHIKSSFNACGILPWSINSAAHFRHNHLNLQGMRPASAMLSIDDECWTLQLWDSDTRIRLTVTRLRGASQSTNDGNVISNELTRVLRAWQVSHPDFTFNALYLDGSKECIDTIMERSSELFSETIIMKSITEVPVTTLVAQSPLMALATMAAVSE